MIAPRSRLRLFPWLALAVLSLLGCACASAQEKQPAPAKAAPAYGFSKEETACLGRALRACGLTRKDLAFSKDRAPSKWKLEIVRRFLSDPLSGPAWAEERARLLMGKSLKRPMDLVAFEDVLGLTHPRASGYGVNKREAEPTDPEHWRDKLRLLAPAEGFTDQELRNICTVGGAIVRSALSRRESRGLHYNMDCPDTLPDPSDTVIRLDQS